MTRRIMTLVLAILAGAAARELRAQRLDDSKHAMSSVRLDAPIATSLHTSARLTTKPVAARSEDVAGMAILGILTGAAGLVVGAYTGYGLESTTCGRSPNEYCGLLGFVLGGLVGEAVGLPIGVHLVGQGKDTFTAQLFASLGITVSGIALATVTQGVGLLVVVPAQLWTMIAIERNAARARP